MRDRHKTHTTLISFINSESTEAVIDRMVKEYGSKLARNEAYQKSNNNNIDGSAVTNKFLKIRIETLQNAPRDPDTSEQFLKAKQKQCDKARNALDTERLVAEIEMLKIVRSLVVNRNSNSSTK